MRDAVKGFVPDEIRLRRTKVGFANPRAEWRQARITSYNVCYTKLLRVEELHGQHVAVDADDASHILAHASVLAVPRVSAARVGSPAAAAASSVRVSILACPASSVRAAQRSSMASRTA